VFKEMQARQMLACEMPLKTVIRADRSGVVLSDGNDLVIIGGNRGDDTDDPGPGAKTICHSCL